MKQYIILKAIPVSSYSSVLLVRIVPAGTVISEKGLGYECEGIWFTKKDVESNTEYFEEVKHQE